MIATMFRVRDIRRELVVCFPAWHAVLNTTSDIDGKCMDDAPWTRSRHDIQVHIL